MSWPELPDASWHGTGCRDPSTRPPLVPRSVRMTGVHGFDMAPHSSIASAGAIFSLEIIT